MTILKKVSVAAAAFFLVACSTTASRDASVQQLSLAQLIDALDRSKGDEVSFLNLYVNDQSPWRVNPGRTSGTDWIADPFKTADGVQISNVHAVSDVMGVLGRVNVDIDSTRLCLPMRKVAEQLEAGPGTLGPHMSYAHHRKYVFERRSEGTRLLLISAKDSNCLATISAQAVGKGKSVREMACELVHCN